MLNNGKSNEGTRINCGECTIVIWPDTIGTGTIRVDKGGTALWQKLNCDYTDLHTAIEIAKLGVQTGIFES
jgi:hypothetical protein